MTGTNGMCVGRTTRITKTNAGWSVLEPSLGVAPGVPVRLMAGAMGYLPTVATIQASTSHVFFQTFGGVFGLKDPKKCKSAKGYVWDGEIEQSIKVADKDSCSKNCRVSLQTLIFMLMSCYVTFCIIMFEYALKNNMTLIIISSIQNVSDLITLMEHASS